MTHTEKKITDPSIEFPAGKVPIKVWTIGGGQLGASN